MKNTIIAAAVAAGVGCLMSAEASEAFRAADAVVVVNSATVKDKTYKFWYTGAITDLTNVIRKVTGRVPAVYEESDARAARRAAPTIYLGETEAAKAAGISGEELRNGDWRIKTVPGKAFLFGKTAMASSYVVTDFVSRYLGYNFYVMDGDDPYDFNPDVAIPLVDVTVKPALYGREIYTAVWDGNRWPTTKPMREAWQRHIYGSVTPEIEGRYRISRFPKPSACHSIYHYLPPDKYFKDHPEWYSMGPDGKRKGVPNAMCQLCYSNMEMRDEVYKSLVRCVEAEYKAHPDNPALVFDMTQMDNTDFMCLCPECKKVIAKYNRKPGGHKEGGDAGLQLEFINDLARRIRVKYPGVQLRVFAYVSSETAPKPGTIAVEPNVVIWWCDVYSVDHTLPLETPGHRNQEHADELNEWLKLTRNMHIWDYMLYGNGFPQVSPDAIAADAKFFGKTGIPRIFMETEYWEQPFFELNSYLMGRLYVDPNLDLEALIDGFCRVYGKGAGDVRAAIDFLRKIEREQPARDYHEWHFSLLPWLTRENMEKLAAMLQRAYDREPDPTCRARILQPLVSTWRQLVSMLKKDLKAKEAFGVAKENYRKYAKEMYATGFYEEARRAKLQAGVDEELELLTLKFDDLPEALKGVADSDLVCIDYHATRASQQKKDPLSSRGRTMSQSAPDIDLHGGYPIACGVYDMAAREASLATGITAEMLPPDGKYHWVKLGVGYVGRNTTFWYPWTWTAGVCLKEYHILSDGAEVDPNWYEFWVSMRVQGPVFVKGATGDSIVALDRIALKRVPPPKK